MTQNEASRLIRTLRRQILFASVWKVGILALIVVASVGAASAWTTPEQSKMLWALSVASAGVWILFVILGLRQTREANQAAVYIATGRLDLAEQQLRTAALAFNLHRRGKLLACHNLAVVAHGRREYETAAALSAGVIELGQGALRGVSRICRILLADCMLELHNPEAARRAIEPIPLGDPGVPLSEQLLLLPIRLRCDAALDAYDHILIDLPNKVRRAELLDSPKAAMCHQILADACDRSGRRSEADFLRKRAELYHDSAPADARKELASDADD
ncbi:MAG TPA: hypothetical protein P5081_18720 [Phycisphaerae bacterium]|nr:hypothetical protein [Phycisphaerae bacterium]HRW54907.1 hypothetical protein [Phycisphaerae bacterium]